MAKPMGYSTRRRHLRDLRRVIEDPASDDVLKRIAYAMETAVKRVTVPVVGWPSLVEEAQLMANLLRGELRRGQR